MIRRYGEAVLSTQKYRLRQGVYVVLLRGDQILLTTQEGPSPDFQPDFQLPGGGVDRGEQPSAALHREVLEETGWRIANIRRAGAFRRFCYMPDYDKWAEKLCTVYTARPALKICEPSELGHRALWLNARVAVGLLGNAGDRAMLAQITRNQDNQTARQKRHPGNLFPRHGY